MELLILKLKEDNTDKIFESTDCQTLLERYENYYTQIGFNLPW
ncbi:MAG: hypothetical protein ABI851_15625 [Saprospiraceae bacterium]